MLGATFGAGQVAYSILWFALIFVEIWLMISIFIDIFRSDDLRGWAKAAWIVVVVVFPLAGILAYLILRGEKCGPTRSTRSKSRRRRGAGTS